VASAAPVYGPFGSTARAAAGPVPELLVEQSRALRDDGSRSLQRLRLGGQRAPGSLEAIVLLCDFSDSLMLGRFGQVPGDFPPPRQTEIYYDAHDSTYFDHLLGQVAAYYDAVSAGRLEVGYTIHARTVNLPNPMSYYGDHPEFGQQSVRLAADLVDSLDAEIDFSLYDTVVLVHAGAGQETDILGDSPEQIFSTYLDPDDFAQAFEDSVLDQPYLPTADYPAGTGIDRVLILPETEYQDSIGGFGGYFGSLGVYCFEFGLHLGMLSLSDFTPSGRPDSQGIGQFGLMGYGLFVGLGYIPAQPCAYNKVLMGWLSPYEAGLDSGTSWPLTAGDQPGTGMAAARVSITGQEYWLLAYRLQDPDGNGIFSFADDKNGNNVPDFWDADSPTGNGIPGPGAKFDAATDSVETLIGAEWDFFMSENNARAPGVKGAGSGVYVWHIDEGVVQDVFDADRNLFNADPGRKSVDLEEADGIQDLDSNQPSAYLLGGDDDSYRGEGVLRFGPDTLPPTATAGGAATGISFENFSKVVADSQGYVLAASGSDTLWGIDYADTMTFDLMLTGAAGSRPEVTARRELPAGTDLRGSHVLIADLDQTDRRGEIILAGHAGEVFVLDGQLDNYLPGASPDSIEPFARGLRSPGVPVAWNLPPAAGDLDNDGILEVVLTAADGIYAFTADGLSLGPQMPGDSGVYVDLPACDLPAVLLPIIPPRNPGEGNVEVCAVVSDGGETFLRRYGGNPVVAGPEINLGEVLVPAVPVFTGGFLLVAVRDTLEGNHRLEVHDLNRLLPVQPLALPLAGVPGPLPPAFGLMAGTNPASPEYFAVVVDTAGRGETVYFDSNLAPTRQSYRWSERVLVGSALATGRAFTGTDRLGVAGTGGDWFDGWPLAPAGFEASADARTVGAPLVADLIMSDLPLDQYIFTGRDGLLFGFGTKAEPLPGWPLAGPGRSAGSPALGALEANGPLELVAVGTFPRVVGTGPNGSTLETELISTVTVFGDVANPEPAWPMWGGNPGRNGLYGSGGGSLPTAASGTGLVAGSHICYPSPLMSGPLFVRGQVRSPGRVRAFVYNLEGEPVASSDWRQVAEVQPFSLEVGLEGAVTGMYLCRLVVEAAGGQRDQSVVQFAVVR
jgi:M6 family metalloprotease-like protein